MKKLITILAALMILVLAVKAGVIKKAKTEVSFAKFGKLTMVQEERVTDLKKGVFNGYSRSLIETHRLTVASLLKKHGYHTACIGKWHLGLTEYSPENPQLSLDEFTRPLRPGPNELGFDYWFGIPASLDMAPYVYIKNGLVTASPTSRIEASPAQLYDMEADPSERRNLYGDPAYREIVEELQALLRRYQEQGYTRPR